jgi:hypothetical protein
MKCERCGSDESLEKFDAVALCDDCLLLIVAEWRIRRSEFGELVE